MNRLFKLLNLTFLVLFLFAGGAIAKNITIWDGIVATGNSPPVDDGEKGEVEPGMQTNQGWWLESFELHGNNLSTTGYFDFVGLPDSVPGYGGHYAGDIFVAIGDAPQYGTRDDSVTLDDTNYRYDYVFDIDWENTAYNNGDDTYSGNYTVYQLMAGGSNFDPVAVSQNDPRSEPYRLSYNGEESKANGSFSVSRAGNLYTASGFDMSFLEPSQEFWAHLTLSCGNDSMMGLGATHAPEPTTMLLLGTGLIGLAGVSRKKSRK